VNPYQWFDRLYTEKKRNYYANRLVWEPAESDPRQVMEPHVYEVSALAYKGLAYEGVDQSILVSGESGAGKTETVKICLNHIASVQRGRVPDGYYDDVCNDPVVQRVVESNPLLEAFGNAKTQRNDNSSRFGKYLQLQFDKNVQVDAGYKSARCGLVGSQCEVYLLEKNRVVGHEPAERNFHIFYQLLTSGDADKARFWSKLSGKSVQDFAYVGHTDTKIIEGQTDAEHFQHTLQALDLVGVNGSKLNDLMRAICIVLQLGQIGFDGDADSSRITTQGELSDLAELMGVSQQELTASFTERTFATRDETHKVPLSAVGAKEACDALAKEAYQKSFLWLVENINSATGAPPLRGEDKSYGKFPFLRGETAWAKPIFLTLSTHNVTFNNRLTLLLIILSITGIIGLLDIFGFEAFKTNRFEQLCINYANEKLQAKFTEDIFRNVQLEYQSEGLDLDDIWYDDNTDVLDLIESKTGLLALLNEECVRPKGNDTSFVQKALQINNDSPCLLVHRTDQLSFGIQHYAGSVMYDAEFFVSKNLDTLPTDLQQCAMSCNNPIISKPRSEPTESKPSSSGLAGRSRPFRKESNIAAPTVWTKYKKQLHTLMADLKRTQSRYIRCIKPNSLKAPLLMEHGLAIDQLRSCGVIAGITISRSVFPNRLDNGVVLARYSGMWDHKNYPSAKTKGMNVEERRAADCKALMACALRSKATVDDKGHTVRAYAVGKTRTYFRAGALEWLESNRMSGLDAQAVTIQRYARGWLARNRGGNVNQRRRYAEEQAELKRQEEEARLARIRKESEERIMQDRAREQGLRDELAVLRQKIAESNRKAQQKISAHKLRKEQADQANDDLRKKTDVDAQRAALEPKKILASQKVKLEEQSKLIQLLKKENNRLRVDFEKYGGRCSTLKGNCDKLHASNSNFGDAFEVEAVAADKVVAKSEDLKDILAREKAENKELKTKVRAMQEKYMDVAQARLELQRTLARILTMIQDNSKDPNVVEDTVVIALGCEADCKAEMAALEVEPTPGLVDSDISNSSFSSVGS